MNPLSILQVVGTAASTAKAAWSVGKGLYTFFQDAKSIDRAVNGMVAEVKALGSACMLVDERLHDIVVEFESSKVHEWMRDIQTIDGAVPRPMPHSEDQDLSLEFRYGKSAREGHFDTSVPIEQVPLEASRKIDVDSDDELALEIAKQALNVARSSLETKTYAEAAAYLQKALKIVRRLLVKQQSICYTFELPYTLSICA